MASPYQIPSTLADDDAALGPYTPSAIIFVILLVSLGIAGDSLRQEYGVEQWAWWGVLVLLIGLTLLTGTQGKTTRVAPKAMPWRVKIANSDYEGALIEIYAAIRAAPEDRLDLYLEMADIYRKPEVALYEDAAAWLTALYDRVVDTPMAATVLLHRAEVYHYGLAKSREAVVDLLIVEREFAADATAAHHAHSLRAKIQADWRAHRKDMRA